MNETAILATNLGGAAALLRAVAVAEAIKGFASGIKRAEVDLAQQGLVRLVLVCIVDQFGIA